MASGIAQATTLDIAFTKLLSGVVSYDADGNDVVGESFFDTAATP